MGAVPERLCRTWGVLRQPKSSKAVGNVTELWKEVLTLALTVLAGVLLKVVDLWIMRLTDDDKD